MFAISAEMDYGQQQKLAMMEILMIQMAVKMTVLLILDIHVIQVQVLRKLKIIVKPLFVINVMMDFGKQGKNAIMEELILMVVLIRAQLILEMIGHVILQSF